MAKHRLIKAERETIMLTSEADDTWDIYTFNTVLQISVERIDIPGIVRSRRYLGYLYVQH